MKSLAETRYLFSAIIIWPILLLYFTPFLLRPLIGGGDQPHYLIVAGSILEEKSFNLRKTYENAAAGGAQAGKIFKGAPLDHHTLLVDTNVHPHRELAIWASYAFPELRAKYKWPDPPPFPENYAEYSCRAVGWPVLIAAFSKLAGLNVEWASLLLSHLAVLGIATLVFLYIRHECLPLPSQVLGSLAILLGSSYWIYANTAFADALQGLILAASLYALRKNMPLLLGFLMGAGIWVKYQFIIMAVTIFVIAMLSFRGKQRNVFVISFALILCPFFICNYIWLGHFLPPKITLVTDFQPLKAFEYFFVSPRTSIPMRNPWVYSTLGFIPILVGLGYQKTIECIKANWKILSILVGIIFPILMTGNYDDGYDYPCRHMMPSLIVFSIAFAYVYANAPMVFKTLCVTLLYLGIFINLVACLSNPNLVNRHNWDWLSVFIQVSI